jgi:lipopolysaccharide heptosyltransferase I
MTAAAPQRILIIKPSSLGDIVHALPVLAGLRARWPGAHIAWLVGKTFAPLLEGHALLDELIVFDRKHYGRMLRSPRSLLDFHRFVRGLRERRFDLVVDLQGLFRSGYLAWRTGARRRVGFAEARELAPLFYTERVAGSRKEQHAVALNLGVARALDLPVEPAVFPLGLGEEELAGARRLVAAAAGRRLEAFTAVIPGARWASKCWPAAQWAALVRGLDEAGLPGAVLLGGPDDREVAEQIVRSGGQPAADLVGRTSLRMLASVIACAQVVVCNDSGPMHIAAALGRPLVAVFGPTNPDRTGPYCGGARVVAKSLPCVPCYRRACPLGHHACMRELEAEAVLAHVRGLMGVG